MTTTALVPEDRARLYNQAFPDRPHLSFSNGWVTGTWCIGACYKNPNRLYGAYPHGYLDRVHSMFPDARQILHAFSGGLTWDHAQLVAWANLTGNALDHRSLMELVDIKGPDEGRYPTWQGDIIEYCETTDKKFDLILADPPYSPADSEEYGTKMPNRADVTRALWKACKEGGTLVWLDTCWPMHRKDMWSVWAHIGLVRSTNHRVRLVSMFSAC